MCIIKYSSYLPFTRMVILDMVNFEYYGAKICSKKSAAKWYSPTEAFKYVHSRCSFDNHTHSTEQQRCLLNS